MAVRVAGREKRFPTWVLAVVLAASAGTADELPESLRRCAEVNDDARRLACYDRYVAKPGAEAGGEDPAPPARPAGQIPAAADAASAEARFGLPDEDDDEQLDEISATIADIVVRASQERIFTLDNGQVWVEDSPKRSVRLKIGDRVRIRSGVLGSFRLVGPDNRSTDVDRVR